MFRRIFEYLDTHPDIVERPDAVTLDHATVRGEVQLDHVVFSYDPDEPVLRDVDLVARPGTLVALVGPSGAGKSTILNLIARLYDPTGGAVRLDGVDLRDLSFDTLSSSIGMVTQESYLFADSLRANIAYGRPDATDDEVEKAARAAAIHDRILELPEGYDTVVGERGFRLSGGERQRIAIARVLLHDPRVLVLDEATSALDSVSERKIQAALAELVSGRTTIAVAHRLSTIQSADVIHVVERGRIVESGTHERAAGHRAGLPALYDEQFGSGTAGVRVRRRRGLGRRPLRTAGRRRRRRRRHPHRRPAVPGPHRLTRPSVARGRRQLAGRLERAGGVDGGEGVVDDQPTSARMPSGSSNQTLWNAPRSSTSPVEAPRSRNRSRIRANDAGDAAVSAR